MSQDITDIFFSLLRSGLYGVPIPESDLPDTIDWDAVVALARKHAVLGIIVESVQFLPDHLRPSADLTAKMNKFALGLIRANMILDQSIARLVSFFNEHNIYGVLLKGQGVARSYYRLPQSRQTGDIDFYVGKSMYNKASALCQEHLITDKKLCHETDLHLEFIMSGVAVELHRLASKSYSPFRNKRFQAWITEELEHSPRRRTVTIGNTDVTIPSYDFDAIFIFQHAWNHLLTGGIGLRQLCDWALIFRNHAEDIDSERLKANIRRFGMTRAWKLFASIAVDYLGVSEDKIPLYDPKYSKQAERRIRDIVAGGNFGYYSEAYNRAPAGGSGFRYNVGLLRNIAGFFISFLPLAPVEATSVLCDRLHEGTSSTINKLRRKLQR